LEKQFEFYFSDSNLPHDKFLRSQVADHIEGYVKIEILAAFPRVKSITQDPQVILDALKTSKMLEVDKDGKMVRRVTQLPENDLTPSRSLYVKGIPAESTIESIEAIFDGFKVLCVRLRREKISKTPKDSCFVEFGSEDEIKKVLGKEFKIGETTLIILPKKKYDEKKKEGILQKKFEQKKTKNSEKIEDLKKRIHFIQGQFVRVDGIGKEEKLNALLIKETFKNIATDLFVEYPFITSGKEDFTCCLLRFKDCDLPKKVIEVYKHNKEILGSAQEPFKVSLLDQTQEDEYLLFRLSQDQARFQKGKKRKGGEGGKKFEKKKREKRENKE